jgi:hypothetical protein
VIGVLAATTSYGKPVAPKYQQVIKAFIDSHLNGSYKSMKPILDNEAYVHIPRGESVILESKHDLLDQMRSTGVTTQKCDYNYEVLAESDALVIARVDFLYGNGIQQNFLTLERDENKDWKIMQVYKMFKDKPEQAPVENRTVSN